MIEDDALQIGITEAKLRFRDDVEVGEKVSKTDFFCDGFSGGKNSKGKRAALSSMLHLPQNLSANALLEAINLITDQNGYRAVVDKLKQAEQTNLPTDAH